MCTATGAISDGIDLLEYQLPFDGCLKNGASTGNPNESGYLSKYDNTTTYTDLT